MGSFRYDGVTVHVDDRTLAHVQIVIVNKLRRGESFVMSWRDSADVGDGRSAIWIHPAILIHFKFEGSRPPAINEEWLATLAASADSSRGLVVTGENGHPAGLGVGDLRPTETAISDGAASADDGTNGQRTRATAHAR